jgi:endogenous inhibitor of DNA gyrase (YacG/DUF329 family)
MVDVITIECPFCGKPIKAFHKPALVREVKKASWGGSKKSYRTDAEVFEVTEDCQTCGKSKKEIENALKHGKEPSNEEIIKRMKDAGLPLKIKG